MRKLPLLLALPLLASCAVGPDYQKPDTALPSFWKFFNPTPQARPMNAEEQAWWNSYKDPVLSQLVDEALKANADVTLAAARLTQARAGADYAQANRLPTLSAQGTATRVGNSEESFAGRISPFASKPYNNFALAAVLDYEVDLWGRFARASESARAQLLSSEANQQAVRLAVQAEVANSYFNLRALDEQLKVAENTVKTRQDAFTFKNAQYQGGNINALVFQQAQAELAAAQAVVPQIRQLRNEQESSIGVLLGRSPKEIVEANLSRDLSISDLPLPPVLPPELPSELMEQRPDIRAAEQALVSANADIGVAKADYFPRLSLSGLLGLNSTDADRLLRGSARNWQIGGGLTGPLFDFGRVGANVEAAKGRKDEALVAYQQTVRVAFKEAIDAMSAQANTAERVDALTVQAKAGEEALRVASLRYDAGYSDNLEVLDAQRTLFQAQLDRISAQRDRLTASVNLFKALGGGWRTVPEATQPAATTPPAEAAHAPVSVEKPTKTKRHKKKKSRRTNATPAMAQPTMGTLKLPASDVQTTVPTTD